MEPEAKTPKRLQTCFTNECRHGEEQLKAHGQGHCFTSVNSKGDRILKTLQRQRRHKMRVPVQQMIDAGLELPVSG